MRTTSGLPALHREDEMAPMRLMCAVRDELWTQFDIALRAYIVSVHELITEPLNKEVNTAATLAREEVMECRRSILEHCTEHGCDPEFVRLMKG